MKLIKLTIQNFRCYKDLQELEFDQDGKITLIYGLSGHGKSTLLHFIKWMFYDIFPGKKDNVSNAFSYKENSKHEPLYNEIYYQELELGRKFSVFGKIDFIHDNVYYELIKEIRFEKGLIIPTEIGKELILNYRQENGSWVEYTGNVIDKINEIIPKALSKYFFFSGEENVIEETNTELKEAIYNLFGLTKYQRALEHLGSKQISYSVIYNYEKAKSANKPKEVRESADKYIAELSKFSNALEIQLKNYNLQVNQLKKIENIITNLTGELAILENGPDYSKRIKEIREQIKLYKSQIDSKKTDIGNKLYRSVPYLILNNQIKVTRNILSESAKNEKTFKDLAKTTLQDILEQKECVCGRCLDDHAIQHIKEILSSMPPHSYNYTYNQFVRDVELKTNRSESSYNKINEVLVEISEAKERIDDLEKEYQKILKKMKNSPDEQIKEISEKLEKARKSKSSIEIMKEKYHVDVVRFQSAVNKYKKLHDEAFKYERIKDDYDKKLEILYKSKSIIENRLKKLKEKTSEKLNENIIEVYNQISTRVEFFNNKKFLNEDFTLRKEYKTGGQDVVDVFAYIIGMIKAIHNVAEEGEVNDFPVVIDAPFSHTDHLQMAHVVDVISDIVPQTAMFTLDIIRIKKSCDLEKFGNVWFIEADESQKVSRIVKGRL